MLDEEENAFNTLGGFVMDMLGRIPAVTDHFDWGSCRFEVMDMDKNRVDKVLVACVSSLSADGRENYMRFYTGSANSVPVLEAMVWTPLHLIGIRVRT